MGEKKLFIPRAQWSSFSSYVLVTTGAVVGLGNVIGFPALVEKFGGLFILFYVMAELLISVLLLFAELMIGRRGKQNPVGSISILAMESQASPQWKQLGWLCFAILCLTLSYYTVTAAFPVLYFSQIIGLLFSPAQSVASIGLNFHSTIASIPLFLCFIIFLLSTMGVIVLGINRGLEQISRITVPLYFAILIGLAIYASLMGNAKGALLYLFDGHSDQSIISVLFAALTFAFFKLNVGMGSMIVYGSYLPYSVSLARSTLLIVLLDAIVSLLAYFTIFPIIFADAHFGFAESLSYDHILEIFAHFPHALMIAALFFFAAIIAAWTPTIAMAESAAVVLIERCAMQRMQAALIVGLGALIVGTFVVMAYTAWSDWSLYQWRFSEILSAFTSQILTPVSAILMAVFSGWVINREISMEELGFNAVIYQIWRLLTRFVAPIFILWILLV